MLRSLMAAAVIVGSAGMAHALIRDNRAVTSGQNIYSQQNPCIADARSLCPETIGNRPAARACLMRKIASVSPACRTALKR